MSEFTWIPIYREIAGRVLPYGDWQCELIDLLGEIRSIVLKMTLDGKTVLIEAKYPFSLLLDRDNEAELLIVTVKRWMGSTSFLAAERCFFYTGMSAAMQKLRAHSRRLATTTKEHDGQFAYRGVDVYGKKVETLYSQSLW